MRPPGSFKIARSPRSFEDQLRFSATAGADATMDRYIDAIAFTGLRVRRIVDSLRREISNAEPRRCLRIRQVFDTPREIFRVELDVPDLSYQRTTLLDREALEELLEADEVREALSAAPEPEMEEPREAHPPSASRPSVRHG